jgi:predicted DNA-binding ribbon-helix-helix protein
MTSRPAKHSLTLNGHRTSVSLEPEFWEAFREIAVLRDQPINALAAEIDAGRGEGASDGGRDGTDIGLASAIRLFVLRHYRAGHGQ